MSRAAASGPRILFRVAAGSRQGFGHLVRARVLSRALGVRHPLVSLRGGPEAETAARELGFAIVYGTAAAVLDGPRPSVIVVDDPTGIHGRRWTHAARRRRIPSASIHDLGRAFCDADLSVDGSLVRARWPRRGRHLLGPRFAILDHRLLDVQGTRRDPSRILIALGGGPRVTAAARVAAAILRLRPGIRVRIAAGFVPQTPPAMPGVRWLPAQPGLAAELARAGAALLGGGMSLYEAVAIGTPSAAWPVVTAQLPTVRAFASAAGVIPVLPGPRRADRAARALLDLLDHPPVSRRIVDGRGAERVAAAIRQLAGADSGEAQ